MWFLADFRNRRRLERAKRLPPYEGRGDQYDNDKRWAQAAGLSVAEVRQAGREAEAWLNGLGHEPSTEDLEALVLIIAKQSGKSVDRVLERLVAIREVESALLS